jgi:legumain
MKLAVVIVLACVAGAVAKDWAVVLAGSNQYYNYRHQADTCHAYQIVRKNGIAPERIIVMQFDDIANNNQNPYRGKVFNKPTDASTPGVDVYAGCQKDYTGNSVTADSFINIITGNAAGNAGVGNGKVLNSTKDDNVFIFFTDHGGTGIIAFPVGPYLTSSRLNQGLQTMNQKKMYNKLVFYLEACESGSMFEGLLPSNMNIYATTASNAVESSWGCYCPPEDQVQGKSIGSCLGDLYSVNWMEDSDAVGMSESLAQQFATVKQKTDQSHVMDYGDKTWTNMAIGSFQGDSQFFNRHQGAKVETKSQSLVESRDIPMHTFYYQYLRADKKDLTASHALAQQLIDEVKARVKADNVFLALTKAVVGDGHRAVFDMPAPTPITQFACFDEVNRAVFDYCGGFSDYSIKYARVVMNVCNYVNHEAEATQSIASQVKALCM